MKKVIAKVFFISMIIMIFGGMFPKEHYAAINSDEFAELENVYESEAPNVEVAEVSSTFTSSNEIEVYLKANPEEIKKVIFSGWSGGVYKEYATSKEAKYDSMRDIYTITFQLNEIVDTQTNEIKNENGTIYSFDAIVYGKNDTMSYVKLEDVQYAENGFITNTETNENNETVVNVTAEQDGYIAIVNANEEITEETEWQPATAGANTYVLPKSEESDSTSQVKILYKAGEEVTEEEITVLSNEVADGASNYQNDETFNFEISQVDGKPSWISYDDTPNIFETTIQGKPNTTAMAEITIYTKYAGTLSFDYMVSSESNFDTFEVLTLIDDELVGPISGKGNWETFSKDYDAPESGMITIKLKYQKDKNINRNDDKAAIRNLKFTSILPTNAEVIINNGDKYTTSKNLNLKLAVDGGSYMYISETPDKPSASAEGWQALADTITYTLKDDTDGQKTIYVWFKNESNAITLRAAKATIKLDTVSPTNNAPALESTSNSIKVKVNQYDANEYVTIKYGYRLNGSTSEYTWIENIKEDTYTITGLTPMQQYEVVTKVFDGANPEVTSEPTTIKTKIPSDDIAITKTPSVDTLNNVTVTIKWNNDVYTKEYSLDNINWETATDTTTIEMTQNGTIYYKMSNETYDTGILEYVVDNIDREGPKAKEISIVTPTVSGKYGIDDELTIRLTWDEEAFVTSAPTLNIKFGDNAIIPLTAKKYDNTTVTYEYVITAEDAGYLDIDSLSGGLVVDDLNNEMTYELPETTGATIFAENAVFVVETNKVYATLQNAIDAVGTTPSVIKVVVNTELRDTLIIKEGQNITIDLNGKEISFESDETIVTAIENSGSLKIKDSSANKNGKVIATSNNTSAYTIINKTTGNLIIENGTIEALSNTVSIALESYAVYNKGAGIVTIGKEDSEIGTEEPKLIATAKNSVGLYSVSADGIINFYDGQILGTKTATYAGAGASAFNMPAGYTDKTESRVENGIEYEVAFLSNDAYVVLTMNGKTTSYKSIFDALEKIPTDGRLGSIKILRSEELTEVLKVFNGQNVEIDLNGYELIRKESIDGYLYGILNNGTLTIKDSSTNQTGAIKAISEKDVTVYGIYNYTNGKLTIDGGKIYAKIAKETHTRNAYGIYIYIYNSNKVSFNSGEIYNLGYFVDDTMILTPNGTYLNQRKDEIDGKIYKVSYTSTNEYIVELTQNGVTTGVNGIQNAVDLVSTSNSGYSTIKIIEEIEFRKKVKIPDGKKVEIDLNGKSMKFYGKNAFEVYGELKIVDTASEQSGQFIGDPDGYPVDLTDYLITTYSTGNLEINGGTILSSYTLIYHNSTGNVIINNAILESSTNNTIRVVGTGNMEFRSGCIISNDIAMEISNKEATVNLLGGEWKGKHNGISIIDGKNINNGNLNMEKSVNLPLDMYVGYRIEDGYVVNYLKEGEYTVELTIGNTTDRFLSIHEALHNIPSDGTLSKIKLFKDQSIWENMEINSGANVEIDLNGNKIYSNYYYISNSGTLTIKDSTEEKSGTIEGNAYPQLIYNNSSGTLIINSGNFITLGSRIINNYGEIEVNGGKFISKSSNIIVNNASKDVVINDGILVQDGYNQILINTSTGNIIINGGVIYNNLESYTYCAIENMSTGNIIINGAVIHSKLENDMIKNNQNGSIIITKGIVPGINNVAKGKIVIGNNDGVINNQDIIINGTLKLNSKGGMVEFYDGVIKTTENTVLPNTVIYENTYEKIETEFVVIIPEGTQFCNVTEGTIKKKYLEYLEGYGDSEILDKESPYVQNIEVIDIVSGEYTKDNKFTIKTFWNENINVIEEDAPQLKIKFGNGLEKLAELKEIGQDFIAYEYTIMMEDNGELELVSYSGGNVTDDNGNTWQQVKLKLSGAEIKAGTKAYVEEKDKYYYNIQKAIDDSELNATEYTKIQLLADDEYYGYELLVSKGKKIEIDLKDKNLRILHTLTGIRNEGDLNIISSSVDKKGNLNIFSNKIGTHYGVYNETNAKFKMENVNLTVEFDFYHSSHSSIYKDFMVYNRQQNDLILKNSTLNLITSICSKYGVYFFDGNMDIENVVIKVHKNWYCHIGKSVGLVVQSTNSTIKFKEIEVIARDIGIELPCLSLNNETEEIKEKYINIPINTYIATKKEDVFVINYLEQLNDAKVQLTIDNHTTTYPSIVNAINNIPNDGITLGNIKILSDETVINNIIIGDMQNVQIDLNGKILDFTDKINENDFRNYGNLTIIDSSDNQEGEIRTTNGIFNTNKLILESGFINSINDSHRAISNSGTVVIYGGKIYSNWNGIEGTGLVEIRGGEITTGDHAVTSNYAVGTIYYESGIVKSKEIPFNKTTLYINNDGTIKNDYLNIPINTNIQYIREGDYLYCVLNYGKYVAELIRDNSITKFTSIMEAFDNIEDTDNVKIRLLENNYVTKNIIIKEEQKVEIDLNGKELSVIEDYDSNIENRGELLINDSSDIEGKIVSIDKYRFENKGTLTINNVYMKFSEAPNRRGLINNVATGNVIINGAKIELSSSDSYVINNESTGEIIINSGEITSNSYLYASIYNKITGTITLNGGVITNNAGNGIVFNNGSSLFYFNGGTIKSSGITIGPAQKIIDLQPHTYVKKYSVNIDGKKYNIAEIDVVKNVKLTNNGITSYFDTLAEAIASAPKDKTLSQIQVQNDEIINSNINIDSRQNIQLDLNGKKITFNSAVSEIRAFNNNGKFEIIDSTGNGLLKVEGIKYNTYGIYNNSSNSKFKLISGTIEVTSKGTNIDAYGIYNLGTSTINGEESVRIEGGTITVKAEVSDDSVTSGVAYGIYNSGTGSIVVLGDDTQIIATSITSTSKGIYNYKSNASVTIGEKDGVINNNYPYIKAETNGIQNGTVNFYDGRVTGPENNSLAGTINDIETDAVKYVINHQDGTESTILLKELKSLSVEPKEFVFKDQSESGEIFVTYLPIDATDVKVNYEIKDDSVANIEITDDKYIVRPKANGETEIVFTVTDLIGNTFTETCKVSVDMTAPTDTAPTAVSTGTKITITCNQTDEHLDNSTIRYSISSDGGVTWSDWTNRETFSGLTPDTEYMVKTKVSDIVGNETESQPTIIKTKLNNNSELALEPDTITKDSVDVIITWNNPQNIPQYYKVDDGEWILVTGETTEVTVTETNVTVYTKLIYDGNEDSDINYIVVDNIDKLAPTGLMNITEETSDYEGNVTLNITALDDATTVGDNAGAVAYIYITEENLSEAPAEDDEKWIRYTGDGEHRHTLPNVEGDYTVYVWFKDKAGNISTSPASDTVKYIQPIIVLIEDDKIVDGYDTIQEAYNVARTNSDIPSTIKVLKSHTMTSKLTIDSTKNIVLDLNGKEVSSSLNVAILNNGKLEVKDSLGSGKFTNTYGSNNVYTIENTANLTISSGTLEAIYSGTSAYKSAAIHNTGANARIIMTDGKLYSQNSNTASSKYYAANGIFNESSYTIEDSVIITGGTIVAEGLQSAYAAGIYDYNKGNITVSNIKISASTVSGYSYGIYVDASDSKTTILSGNIYSTSYNSTAYGVGMSLYSTIILGTNDGKVDNDILTIEGKYGGIYRGSGNYYFYDGTIIGSTNNSIIANMSDLVTPTNYGILKTRENNRETATLLYDDIKPTVESVEITNNVDVNSQTLTAKGIEDIGTGVVGYYTSQNQTVPTKTSVYWTGISQTNGPTDISKDMTFMGTWYFWVIDSAGNVSETKSVVAENIKIKATYAYIDAATGNVGEKVQMVTRLSPENAEPKSTLFTSSDTKVAYIDSETGIATCLAEGTTNITYTVINYDGTTQKATAVLTVIDDKLNIIEHPIDRTVKEGTTTTFGVTAEGNNLSYQWYEIVDGQATKLDEKSSGILKSNIEGQSNAKTSETIIIKTTSPGTVSFDYMVSSEENNDIFKITVEDINGEVTAVDNISGNVDWTNYSKTVTPTATGEVKITLTYTKNDSVDAGLDFGAIKNLKYELLNAGSYISDFTSDGIITIKSKDTSVNTNSNHDWIIDNTNGLIYKSNSKDQHGSYATASIEIKMEEPGEISFDYRVSSESGYDKLFITIIEGNNKETIVGGQNGLSGAGSWQTYKATVTPNDKGIVRITLLYQKDGSVSKEDDMGAIRNLTVPSTGFKSTLETDNIFELSNNFEKISYQGVNTANLTIPGELVVKGISGNGYYCAVSNTRTVTSDVATLTVADEEVPVDNSVTRTAPTLVAEYKKITATCNQVGEGITNTYYAISSDGITYGEWQESNVFENITEGEIYYVKTKVKNANGEVESASSSIFAPVYIASLTENGVTTYYSSVQDAVDAANANNPTEKSKIVLLNDEIRDKEVKIISGKNISFDLNGNELKFVYNSSSNYNGINNYGKLEIIDTGSTGKIDILSSRTSRYYAYGIYNQSGATLDLKQGEIVVTRPTSYSTYARGIYNYYGTFTIGEDEGNVSIENPKITSTGYGIYNNGSGKISFYDGIITADKGLSTSGTITNYAKNCKLKKEEKDGKELAYLEELKVDTEKALITEWTIPANNTTITLPISTNTNVNLVVDWGDNSALELVNARTFPTHKYASAGVYNIKISGTCYDFGNYNQSTSSSYTTFTNYLTGLIQWGELGATRYGFANCTKLAGSIPAPMEKTFENVTNMSNMFYNCSSLTSLDLSKWNTEKVTNMGSMFYNCSNLTLIILGKDFDKLSGTSMFSGCNKLTAVITQRDILDSSEAMQLVENTGLKTQSNIILYVPNEVSEDEYEKAVNYNKEFLSTEDTSEDMYRIRPILELVGDKVVKVPKDYKYDETVDKGVTVAGIDIPNTDDSFYGYSYTVSGLPVKTDVGGVSNSVIYTLNYKDPYVSGDAVTSEEIMSVSREIRVFGDPILMQRETQTTQNESGESIIESKYIIGAENTTYTSDSVKTITFENNMNIPEGAANWDVSKAQDGSVMAWIIENGVVNGKQMYDLHIGAMSNVIYASEGSNLFADYINCTAINKLEYLDTAKVTNMNDMFFNCRLLTTLNLNTFNTTNTTNMKCMFKDCIGLKTLNLNGFDTSNVTDMQQMFYRCSALEGVDVSNFNTTNVNNMYSMFWSCTSLKSIDVSNFDTSNVTYMRSMFNKCKSLTELDLRNFNINSNVTMEYMLLDDDKLEILLLGKNFTKLAGAGLFSGCTSLTTIIAQSETPITITDNISLNTLENAILYVPNKTAEEAYEKATNYEAMFGAKDANGDIARIKPMLEIVGPNPVLIKEGATYTESVDEGFKVAGFEEKDSGKYTKYGYSVTTSGLPVDTKTAGDKKVIYTLSYPEGTGSLAEVMSDERIVRVIALDKIFETEWNVSAGLTITLPITKDSTNYYAVDWGDGSFETIDATKEFPSHTYSTAGTYTISVMGTMKSFASCENDVSIENLTGIKQWGELTATHYDFYNAKNLTGVIPTPSEESFKYVTDFSKLFMNCSKLRGTIPTYLFEKSLDVTTLNSAFKNCVGLTGHVPVTMFEKITKVNDLTSVFEGCTGLTSVEINTNVIGENMFYGCNGITDITIGNNVQTIGKDAFQAVTPYSATYMLATDLTSSNEKALKYDWTGDYRLILDKNALVTTWVIPVDKDKTKQTTGTAQTTIVLPVIADLDNKYTVNWGDGEVEEYTKEGLPTHTYENTEEGKYTIQVSGKVNSFGYYRNTEPTEDNIYSDYYMFVNSLETIKYWGNIGLRRIGFAYCKNLKGTIPAATGFTNLVSVENMFLNCTGLTEPIQSNFLAEAKEITNAKAMFKNCINIKGSISKDLFTNNTKITTFESTFENCQNITGEIPETLFATTTEVTNYARTFKDCYKVSGVIPGNLFTNSPLVENFRETFANCSKLTSPAVNSEGVQLAVDNNLFANNKYVLNYYRTFYNCTGLTGVVDGKLFGSNMPINELPEKVTATTGLIGIFEGCTGIKEVVNYEKLIVGHYMFKNCTSLESISLAKAIEIGEEAFYGCNVLTKINVEGNYLNEIGQDAFEYTGTDPKVLFTYINPENKGLAEYDWTADNREIDIDAPKGLVEIVTDKYPFTNTTNVELAITITDNCSEATKCEIAIINEDVYEQLETEVITHEELPWQAYVSNRAWTLTSGEDCKTVWVFFKDEVGNHSMIEKKL